MTRSTLDLVQDLYAAFGARDEAALEGLLAPDVRWTQCPGFPGGADRTGARSVIEGVLGGLNREWTDFGLELEEFIEAGARVVVIGAYSGVHAQTQRSMRSVFTHVYEADGERITRFRQYADTWPMVAAQRDLELELGAG